MSGVGTVTEVGRATRVAIAASGTAAALAVGAVGVVLAVDDRQPPASNVTNPSASGVIASATQPTPAPSQTRTVPPPPPLLLPNMRSLNASDLQIEVVGNTRRLRFAASLANAATTDDIAAATVVGPATLGRP